MAFLNPFLASQEDILWARHVIFLPYERVLKPTEHSFLASRSRLRTVDLEKFNGHQRLWGEEDMHRWLHLKKGDHVDDDFHDRVMNESFLGDGALHCVCDFIEFRTFWQNTI